MPARERSATDSPDTPPSGLTVSPFRAVRYTTTDGSALTRLTSPAYDLVDAAGRASLERTDPFNVVRLILPRPGGGPGDDEYTRASRTLHRWRAEGILAADPVPAVYRYEIADGEVTTRGLVATVDLRPSSAGAILPHEATMAGPVADRLALLTATEANFEPIVLVHDGADPTEDVDIGASIVDVHTDDGVRHRVWAITDPAVLTTVAAILGARTAVIADGHHRYASYLRHQARRHADGDGPGPWDRAMVFLVALGSRGMRTEAIHRVLPGLELSDAVRMAGEVFALQPLTVPAEGPAGLLTRLRVGQFLITDSRRWFLLRDPSPSVLAAVLDRLPQGSADAPVGGRPDLVGGDSAWPGSDAPEPVPLSPAWRTLDVTVAHHVLISTLWGRSDDEASVRLGYDLESTLAAVRPGGTALLLAPTPADSVLAVARHGELMPRKSTLFVPKPRTGLLLRCFSDEQ